MTRGISAVQDVPNLTIHTILILNRIIDWIEFRSILSSILLILTA